MIEKLFGLDNVAFVGELSGERNLLTFTHAEHALALGNLCDNQLLCLSGLRALQMLVAHVKHQYDFSHFQGQGNIPKRK